MKTAIITGICGQDGAYLAQHLLSLGYRIIGWARRNSSRNNLEYLGVDIEVLPVDICDPFHVASEIERVKPDEIYNLAAQSHVGQSFKNPMQTCTVNYGGYLNILLAARKSVPNCLIYQAGTSEMFGYAADTIANEQTPFAPMSPYAISKVAAYWAGVNARYEANQFVCNGILFNHESPIRGEDFVTRKISKFVANWSKNKNGVLRMGNIDSIRDWGFAGDYVKAMHLMLQYGPEDFVIATGQAISVRHLIRDAFAVIGKDIEFEGEGLDERGYVDGIKILEINPDQYRPNDLKFLKGNASRARHLLKWEPTVTINRLIGEMVREDMR